jgi:hypothetical protein
MGSTKFGRQWQAAVECNVKNMYFVQKNVENVEIFVQNNNFPSLMIRGGENSEKGLH